MQLEEEETSFHRAAASNQPQVQSSSYAAGGHPEVTEPPPQLPTDVKGYYACRSCRRILVEAQWYKEGCLGCGTGPVHRGELADYATPHFTNFFGLIDPSRSWVARLIGKAGRGPDGNEVPNAIYAEALDDEEIDDGADEEEDDDDDGEEGNVAEGVSTAVAEGDEYLPGENAPHTRNGDDTEELGF